MGPLVHRVENVLLQKHLKRQAARLGMEFESFSYEMDKPPMVLVSELEQVGVLEEVALWKSKWPGCFVALSVSQPDKELWVAAETAGADLVANRGALPRLVFDRLKALQDGVALTKKKILLKAKPIVNDGDGLIGRLPDSTEDPIAIFKWKDRLCAVRDICPHAGFSLADGDFDASTGVVTCPEHGSRFNVQSGERVRGPADYSIKTYPITIEGNDIYVHV